MSGKEYQISDEELIELLGKCDLHHQKMSQELIDALDAYQGDPIVLKEKKMKENFLTVVTYYSPEDKDFMDDYHYVEILDSTGVVVANYGDHYHDKGRERALGFTEGILWVYPQYRNKINFENRNISKK
mgnify:CR=1 FL=1